MKESPSLQTDGSSDGQEILSRYKEQKKKFPYRVHSSPPVDPYPVPDESSQCPRQSTWEPCSIKPLVTPQKFVQAITL
jgi:hypothetical protein